MMCTPPIPARAYRSSSRVRSASLTALPIHHQYAQGRAGLLSSAIVHFTPSATLTDGPLSFDELRGRLGLDERPANVLITALRAMGLLPRNPKGDLDLTPLAREHLIPGAPFDISDYVGLS